MSLLDDLAKANGFESAMEMHRLIAQKDISTPEKLAAFQAWRDNDGTKAGLLATEATPPTVTESEGA